MKRAKGFSLVAENAIMEVFAPHREEKVTARRGDEERVVRLLESYREDCDAEAGKELLARHERLLNFVVRRHAGTSEDSYEDLLQVGYVGLTKAMQGYEAGRGATFASYAYSMIDGEIRHHRRDTSIVKRPRWARSLYSQVSAATARLEEDLGRPPTEEEISEEANVTPEGIREVRKLFHETDATSLEVEPDLSVVRSLRHESFALPIEDRIVLEQALNSLSELQRKVVYLFFYKDLTQTEIGKRLGLSQRKVSRTIASSKDDLRGLLDD